MKDSNESNLNPPASPGDWAAVGTVTAQIEVTGKPPSGRRRGPARRPHGRAILARRSNNRVGRWHS
jgi:hypothetical protein